MKAIRVVLADDHALVRAGIRSLLERIAGVEVVGDADTGPNALALIEARRPDVAFVDIAMGGMSGIEVAAHVAEKFPWVKVIILSMHAHEGYVAAALRAGAIGYVLKDSVAAELDLALEAAGRGQLYLSAAISRTVIKGYLAGNAHASGDEARRLTPRQRDVLTLVASGKSTKEIAGALHLSAKTVESHRARLMERLKIHDVPGLVKYALQAGLIPPLE